MRIVPNAGLLLATLLASAAAAPPSCLLRKDALIELNDGTPLATAAITMHAPGWVLASNRDSAAAEAEGNGVQGALRLPAACTGMLNYDVEVRRGEADLELGYALGFSAVDEILHASIAFLLPAGRFQGRAVRLLPGGEEESLPTNDEAWSTSGTAAAVAIALDARNRELE